MVASSLCTVSWRAWTAPPCLCNAAVFLPNCEGELASVILRRVAYGRAPGLLSARMHDWSPCEVGRTRETGSLPHTELGASISSRRAAPLLEAQVTLHGLSVESVLATERAASTAATRRSEVMFTRASRRRKALHCCTNRRRRAALLCLKRKRKGRTWAGGGAAVKMPSLPLHGI